MLVQYATAKIGVILVNINPAYRTSELEYALRQSGCRMLISAPAFKTSDYRAMVAEVRPGLPDLEQVVFLDSEDWDAAARRWRASRTSTAARARRALEPEDPINIQYTSGTTGFPKGATLSHLNILNNGFFIGEGCRYTEHDRVCIPVPFYHCFGMVLGNLACTTHGAAIVIPAPAFDPEATLSAGGRRAVHVAVRRADDVHRRARPSALRRLRPELAADRDHGRLAVPGRGHEAGDRADAHERGGDRLRDDRDLAGLDADRVRRSDSSKRVGTVGRVHPHVEIKIVDPDDGETVARGASGELCTRGYSVMSGYWNDPERTAEAIDEQGWMHTGDLATMDDEGYVNIVGRIKDMVIRGGENIYPREVEEFLYAHPDIADVQVIGVPDERYGEELMAWVIPRGADDARRRAAARVLPRQDRALQDPALRQARRRVPDDRHRQGAEVQDARAGDRRARPRRLGEHPDCMTGSELRARGIGLRRLRGRGSRGADDRPGGRRHAQLALGVLRRGRGRSPCSRC